MKIDVNYWKQYLNEGYSQVPQIEVDPIIRAAVDEWNGYADGEENKVQNNELYDIHVFAYGFHVQSGGYLDTEVVQAYIMQKETFGL